MNIHDLIRGCSLLLLMASAVVQAAHAADAPLPDPVPAVMAGYNREFFENQRTDLLAERADLIERVRKHNAHCQGVPKDSPQAAECAAAQSPLQGEVRRFAARVRAFNAVVAETSEEPVAKAQRIKEGLRHIHVPPPISPDVVRFDAANSSKFDKWLLSTADAVVYGGKVLGYVLKDSNLAMNVIMVTGKSFIAAEDGALLYVTAQNEVYDRALDYLRDPGKKEEFLRIVRAVRRGEVNIRARDERMIEAARALHDPRLQKGGWGLAWGAMISPEARTAALNKACVETAGVLLGNAMEAHVKANDAAFREASEFREKAVTAYNALKPEHAAAPR